MAIKSSPLIWAPARCVSVFPSRGGEAVQIGAHGLGPHSDRGGGGRGGAEARADLGGRCLLIAVGGSRSAGAGLRVWQPLFFKPQAWSLNARTREMVLEIYQLSAPTLWSPPLGASLASGCLEAFGRGGAGEQMGRRWPPIGTIPQPRAPRGRRGPKWQVPSGVGGDATG